MRAVAYLLGECGLHGCGCVRLCVVVCGVGVLLGVLVMRSFEM